MGFFSHIFHSPIFRAAAPLALMAIPGFQGLGAALGGSLLGAGAAGSATLGNALIGGGLGALGGGGLKGAALGALGAGVGANLGSIGAPGESGSGILGAAGRNIPGLQSLASDASGLGSGISKALGLNFGNAVDSSGLPVGQAVPGLAGGSAADQGLLNNAIRSSGIVGSTPNVASLVGGSTGGGSTFGGGGFNIGSSIASALGGANQDKAIKKAQQQLLASNNQQMANLGTFDPSNITNDAGYQFNLAEGQKGLDRSAAAVGGLFSGKALKAASQYNQNYAGNALQSAYQRWLDQTGAKNQILANQGNINSQGTVAGANNLSSSLSGVLNPTSGMSTQDLLKLLSQQKYTGTPLYA